MTDFANQLVALGVPRSTIELTGLINWIVAFVSFSVMVVLWVLLLFNAVPGAPRGWLVMNPLMIIFFGSLLTPRGKTIRIWVVITAIMFSGAVIVGITMAKALQQMPSPT